MIHTQNKLKNAIEGFSFAFLSCLSSWYLIGLILSLFFATLKVILFLWFGSIAGLMTGSLIFFMVLTMYTPEYAPDGIAES